MTCSSGAPIPPSCGSSSTSATWRWAAATPTPTSGATATATGASTTRTSPPAPRPAIPSWAPGASTSAGSSPRSPTSTGSRVTWSRRARPTRWRAWRRTSRTCGRTEGRKDGRSSAAGPSVFPSFRLSVLSPARLLPVDEEKPARRVEPGLPRPGEDLELQLLDRVLRAVPAREGEVVRAAGAGEQHHVHHRLVGDLHAVPGEMPERPERHRAVDGGDERRVDPGVAVVVEAHDHAVPGEMPERPERHRAVDGGDERRV